MLKKNRNFDGISMESTQKTIWINDLKRSRQEGPTLNEEVEDQQLDFQTLAIHAGQYDDPNTGALGTPIYQCSTFYLNKENYDAVEEGRGRDALIYTRYGNPTLWALQNKLSALENAESSIVFSSGMSAISTTLLALLDKGSHIVTSRDLYGGSYNFIYEDLQKMGMSASFVDPTNLDAIERAITPKTKMLYFESLTNPLLKLVPLYDLAYLAKKHHLRLVIDNTFLTPYNLKPLDVGVDIVINSATKYLNGHSDLIAGTVSGSRKLMDRIWGQMLKLGGSMDPHVSFLLERSLKSLGLRMKAHNENGLALAKWLEDHAQVKRVYYPGLDSYPYKENADQLLKIGFSGMISFEVVGGDQGAIDFVRALHLPKEATSLGGMESLVSLPFNTSQASLTRVQRKEIGINEGLVRLSVGVEDLEDLKNNIDQALLTIKTEEACSTTLI